MKSIVTSVIVAVILIGGAYLLAGKGNGLTGTSDEANIASQNNVSVENGIQVVEIKAKGGYSPRKSAAKAGLPTVVRFNTNGTFDCSASIRIPSLKISKILPQNGSTDIDIGSPVAGALRGSCGMGMYPFEIDFQS